MGGHGHDRPRAVAHEHVVGHPDRDALAIDGVHREGTGEHARFLLGLGGAFQFGLVHGLVDVGGDFCLAVLRGDFVDQRMLRREDHVGCAEQRVGPGRVNADYAVLWHGRDAVALGLLVEPFVDGGAIDGEVDLRPDALADPVALHDLDRLGPIDLLDIGQESLGIGGDAHHPLGHCPAVDGVVAALRATFVGDFLVGQHRTQLRAPVDRHLSLVGEAVFVDQPPPLVGLEFLELVEPARRAGDALDGFRDGRGNDIAVHVDNQLAGFEIVDQFPDRPGGILARIVPGVVDLQEDPLRPPVVVWVGRSYPAGPVIREAEHPDLPLDVADVLLGGFPRVHAMLHGVLFCRQSERIVAHRMEHVESGHPLEPCDDVGGGVAFRMAHMQAGPGRVGEHVQHVVLGFVCVEAFVPGVGLPERSVLLPIGLPLGLDGLEVVAWHLDLLLVVASRESVVVQPNPS